MHRRYRTGPTHHIYNVVVAVRLVQGWLSSSISRAVFTSALDVVVLVLEGVVGKRHGDVHGGDVVIFCYIRYLCHRESRRSVSLARNTNGPSDGWQLPAGDVGVSLSIRGPASRAMMMSPRLRLVNLVQTLKHSGRWNESQYINWTFRLGGFELKDVLSSPAP